MALSTIADETGFVFDGTTDLILSDAKVAVIDYMDQMKQLSDSQEKLLTSIRSWLGSSKLPQDADDDYDNIPNPEQVFAEIAQMIHDYTNRTEHVTCLHNDISDMWYKKFGALRRATIEKDEEIKKLQKIVEQTKEKLAKEKRERKKLDENNPAKQMKQQMDQTLRQNEEMKRRIEAMKFEMNEKKVQDSLANPANHTNFDEQNMSAAMEMMKLENEQNVISLQVEIDELKQQLQQSQQDNRLKDDEIDHLRSKLDSKDRLMQDMEANYKKHLELASLEKVQQTEQKPIENPFEDQYYDLKLKQEKEIRKLHDFYAKKLQDQQEQLNKSFAQERTNIFKSFQDNGSNSSAFLKTITDECERRIESVKSSEQDKRDEQAKDFNRRLMILTKQYERRIENLCSERDIEQANVKNNIQYEVKKAEIKMQEQLSLQTNEISAKFEERIEKAQKQVNSYAQQLEETQKELQRVKKQLLAQQSYNANTSPESDSASEQAANAVVTPVFIDSSQNMSDMEISDMYKMKYTAQLKNLQDVMEEQKVWELEQQKKYYENEIKKALAKNQREVREKLVGLTEALNDNSEENRVNILNALSDSLVTLNTQIDSDDGSTDGKRVPLMPISEATERTNLLTEQVENLTFELVDAKDLRKAYDQEYEKNKALEAKISLLEQIANAKDNKSIQEALENVEKQMQMQLKQKNDMIQKLTEEKHSTVPLSFEWFTIYNRAPKDGDDFVLTEDFHKLRQELSSQSSQKESKEAEQVPEERKEEKVEEKPQIVQQEENHKSEEKPKIEYKEQETQSELIEPNEDKEKDKVQIDEKPKLISFKLTKQKTEDEFSVNIPHETKDLIIENSGRLDFVDNEPPQHIKIQKLEESPEIETHIPQNIEKSSIPQKALRYKPPAVKHNNSDAEDDDDDYPVISSSRSYSAKKKTKTMRRRKIAKQPTKEEVHQNESDKSESEKLPKEENPNNVSVKEVIKYVEKPVEVIKYVTVAKPVDGETNIEYKDESSQSTESPKNYVFVTEQMSIEPQPETQTADSNESTEPEQSQISQAPSKASVLSYVESEWSFENKEEDHTFAIYNDNIHITPEVKTQVEAPNLITSEPKVEEIPEAVQKKVEIKPFTRPLRSSISAADIRLVLDHFRQDMMHFRDDIKNKIAAYVPKTKLVVIHDTVDDSDNTLNRNRKQPEMNLFRTRSKEQLGIPILTDANRSNSVILDTPKEESSERENEKKHDADPPPNSPIDSEADSEVDDVHSTHISEQSSLKSKLSVKSNLSNPALTFEYNDEYYKNDPFGCAVNLVGQSMRFLNEFKEQQDNTYNEMWNCLSAFDCYCSATGNQDESLLGFLQELRQQKQELDEQQNSLYRLFNANEKTLKLLKQLKQMYRNLQNSYSELEMQQKSSQQSIQQNVLNTINNDNDQLTDADEVTRVETLSKLSNSLDLIESSNLVRTDEERNALKNLKAEIMSLLDKPEKEAVESVSKRVQDFVSSLGSNMNVVYDTSRAEESQKSDSQSLDQLKKDLKRVRKMRDTLKKQFQDEKEKTHALQTEIETLKNNLEEEKDNSQNQATFLKAQIDSLKELLGPDQKLGQSTGSTEDVFQKVKDHALNMQVLIDTTAHERDIWKSKYQESNSTLKEYEDKIKELQDRIKDLLTQEDKNLSRITDFSKLGMTDSKEDLLMQKATNNNNVVSEEIKKELEETLAQNKLLYQRNNELERLLIQVKSDLREANDQIDDLKLKNACCVKEVPPLYYKHIGTQCRLISSSPHPHKAKQHVSNEMITIKETDEEVAENKELQKKIDKYAEKVKKTPEKIKAVPHEEKTVETSEENSTYSTEEYQETEDEVEEPRITLASRRSSTNKLMSTTTLLREMENQREELDGFDENLTTIQQESDDEHNDILKDTVPHVVHSPLTWQKKKKPTVISPSSSINPMSSNKRRLPTGAFTNRSKNLPSIDDNSNGVDPQLTINGAKQGIRSLHGTNVPIKPTQSISAATTLICSTVKHPDNKLQSAVKTTIVQTPSFSSAQVPQNEPKQAPPQNMDKIKGNVTHPIDIEVPPPTRITVFVNPSVPKTSVPSPTHGSPSSHFDSIPMDASQSRQSRFAKPLSSLQNSQTCPQSPLRSSMQIVNQSQQQKQERRENQALNEALKRIAQLKDQRQTALKQVEAKDAEIVTLKQKISELTLLLHRSKLDAIRANDSSKRAMIRYDNAKQRLDVAIQELSTRDEENMRLKRELNQMKRSALPAATHSIEANKAKQRQNRLNEELRHKDALLKATSKALSSTPKLNSSVKRHLETLMANTQRSIARINAQRKMWKEEETRHMLGALSALSLLEDSQFKVVRDLIPDYSPFKRSTRIDSIISRIGLKPDSRYYDDFYQPKKEEKSFVFEAKPISVLNRNMQ